MESLFRVRRRVQSYNIVMHLCVTTICRVVGVEVDLGYGYAQLTVELWARLQR
jgi:hypothetical protein